MSIDEKKRTYGSINTFLTTELILRNNIYMKTKLVYKTKYITMLLPSIKTKTNNDLNKYKCCV